MNDLPRSAQRVADALAGHGLDVEVRELPDSTRSARDAADTLGCEPARIVKSLVFRSVENDQPVLALVSGIDSVDEERLAAVAGGPLERAAAAWVKERTGFAVGGVPPLGHSEPLSTTMDSRLLDLDIVWAAAGTPRAVFAVAPQALLAACDAHVADIAV